MSTPPFKFELTQEEYDAHIERHFMLDERTGEIVGERLSSWRIALLDGVDWDDDSDLPDDFDENITAEIPRKFLYPESEDDLGR
ncbi:MAG: hypothetical protein OXF31_12570 [Gammaproteobacteria bacterium]|nr:hypothetical protein [Gammaproteobacteria bacterium]